MQFDPPEHPYPGSPHHASDRAGIAGRLARYAPRLALVVMLAGVYFAAATFGLSLATTHKNVSLVWPPTGIALAALLFFGSRAWPGIMLGAFLVNATTAVSLATAGGIALGNTLEALGAILSTTPSATIGVASLCLGGSAPWAAFGSLWGQWWLGDAMGDLVVAPALLVWGSQPRVHWHHDQAAEAGALLALLTTVSLVVFGGWFTTEAVSLSLAFATFPFVIWAALRFAQSGAVTATLVVSGAAIWGTVRHTGPFLGKTLTESFLLGQIFMSVVAVTALVLAAGITQRRRVEERFRLAVEAAPNAMIMVDAQGTILLVNAQAQRLFGYTREELLGLGIDRLVPESFRGRHPESRAHFFADPRTRPMGAGRDLFALRKDGSEIPVEIGLNPITTDGAIFVLAAIIDITERKRTEAALAQANQQLTAWVRELEQRTYVGTLLGELGDLLQSCLTADEAHRVITEFAPRLLPAESGLLGVVSASRRVVEVVAVWGEPAPSKRVFAPEQCWALRRGQVHCVKSPRSGSVCDHVDPSRAGGCLCVPMMAQGEPLGVLHLRAASSGSAQPGGAAEPFTEPERHLAVIVAEHIALALANLRLRETLRSQAIRDPLTGLFNRRYMEESLERETHRATRGKTSLGIIMIDIDHFKRVNDTSGHEAGDILLAALGGFLRAHVRAEDIACRYGGEEFTLILPDASLGATLDRASQIREEVKHLQVPYRGQRLEGVTLSLGVASFPKHGSSSLAILQAADAALYRAKQEGRDRVFVAR